MQILIKLQPLQVRNGHFCSSCNLFRVLHSSFFVHIEVISLVRRRDQNTEQATVNQPRIEVQVFSYVEFDSLDIVAVARYGFKAETKTFNIRRQASNCTLKRGGRIQLENVDGWQAKIGNIPNWIAAERSRLKCVVILYYAEVEGMVLR